MPVDFIRYLCGVILTKVRTQSRMQSRWVLNRVRR